MVRAKYTIRFLTKPDETERCGEREKYEKNLRQAIDKWNDWSAHQKDSLQEDLMQINGERLNFSQSQRRSFAKRNPIPTEIFGGSL